MIHRLTLESIVKNFGNFRANDDVSLQVKTGSVHAILGENGAGKSTLMNIIYGLYQPDSGKIFSRGEEVSISSPRRALDLGIGMVHQHFKQVENMTVVENLILGLKGQWMMKLNHHRQAVKQMADDLGFSIEPEQQVWRLPVGMQQRVEILKLLYRNADLLILDEPTSVLTPNEIGPFFKLLRRLREMGSTIILITHKLNEVMDISDRATVMRSGRVVANVDTAQTTQRELATLMVGREVVFNVARRESKPGKPVLEVNDLTVLDDRRLEAVSGLSMTVREGEILGVAGVDGNGQAELAEAITGLRSAASGRINVSGMDVTGISVARRKRDLKVGFVPEDRHRVGLDLDATLSINSVLRSFKERPFSRRGWLDFQVIDKHAEELVSRYDVRMRGVHQKARDLSGGNQQKIVVGREIEGGPKLLVVSQATKGLDVGAIEFVQKTLLAQRDRGTAILYISTELEELLNICDRVAVIFKGRIAGEMNVSEATSERIGLLMTGGRT
jgi:simple sugar transport system ATP-binding protein